MGSNSRTLEQVRREIEAERDQLADAVDHLRSEIEEVTDVRSKLKAHLPVVTGAALGARVLPLLSISTRSLRRVGRRRAGLLLRRLQGRGVVCGASLRTLVANSVSNTAAAVASSCSAPPATITVCLPLRIAS